MRLLSDILGLPVVDCDGRSIGQIHDLSTRLSDPHPAVVGVVVAAAHRHQVVVPWTEATLARTNLCVAQVVAAEPFARKLTPLGPDEILLRRDLLDTQIIDLNQHRAARVGDVILGDLGESGLEVVAVEVGGRALVRRLGLRAVARRLPEHVIDFADLHLTSTRGHAAQVRAATAPLHRLDARGLAELLTRLDLDSAADVLDAVGPARAARAVDAAHPVVKERLLSALDSEQIESMTATMRAPEAAAYRTAVSRPDNRLRRRLSRHLGWRLHPPPSSDHDADSSAS